MILEVATRLPNRIQMKNLSLIVFLGIMSFYASAQKIEIKKEHFTASKSIVAITKMDGENVVNVRYDTTVQGVDNPTFAKVMGSDFNNGIIEVKVLGRIQKNAPSSSRGFIGIAFRVNDDCSKFENIYLRPTNGRADDQIRRNHSTQYFSYPDYKFDRLRKESPEKYESYADMGIDEWITMRIEIEGTKAKLYVNDAKHPTLIVNDLKHGASLSGSVGLYVGNWTDGYFKDLKIWKK